MKLKDKVAIITGGASGIGEATAELFAMEGAAVIVADIDEKRGQKVVSKIKKTGARAIFVRTDVSQSQDCKRMVDETLRVFDRLDILFNNAGTILAKKVTDTTEEEWDKVMGVNLKGVFFGCKFGIPAMLKSGGGSIINNASISGLVGLREQGAYCPSKGGVIMLTKQVALDYAKENIRVNAICPGSIEGPLLKKFLSMSNDPEGIKEAMISAHPMGRIGKPMEVAEVALFLASDESSFVTGSVIVVDGGYTAQ